MNLLVIGMNYAPERTGIATYTTDLCEHLTRRGHRVTVATTLPHYPEWQTHPEYAGKRSQTEIRNGVTLKRKAVFLPTKGATWQRVLYDSSLAAGAWLSSVRLDDFDLILGVEPPIQVGGVARMLAAQKHVPYALWVQDLALEAALSVGMMRESTALKLARRLELWAYAGAARILMISHGSFENVVRKGVPRARVRFLPNWIDTNLFGASAEPNGFRRKYGMEPNALVALHSGNMGAKQQLENVLGAAEQLQAHSQLEFVLVGDGLQKQELVARAEQLQLRNVRFLPLVPQTELPQLMASADILLLNQHPDILDAVIPSKLLMYMAAARPVVIAAHPDSEAARQVRAADCGVLVPANAPSALASAVQELAADPTRRQLLGQRGRDFVIRHFERQNVLKEFEAELLRLVG